MFIKKFEYFAFKKATTTLIPIKSIEISINKYKNSLKISKNICIISPKNISAKV